MWATLGCILPLAFLIQWPHWSVAQSTSLNWAAWAGLAGAVPGAVATGTTVPPASMAGRAVALPGPRAAGAMHAAAPAPKAVLRLAGPVMCRRAHRELGLAPQGRFGTIHDPTQTVTFTNGIDRTLTGTPTQFPLAI